MLESNDLFRYVKSCVNAISRHQTGDVYIESVLAATQKQISEYKNDIWEKEYFDLLLAPHLYLLKILKRTLYSYLSFLSFIIVERMR